MRLHRAVLLCALLQLGSARAQDHDHEPGHAAPKERTAPDGLTGTEAGDVALYQKVLPTVVTIFATRSDPTPEGPKPQRVLGSGVLISPECHVLTAAHVVENADEILVKTQEGRMRPARLLYSEPSADIALVRLETPDPTLKHAELGDSDRLAVGQRAYVVGAPYGLENSFSLGHVSAFREFGHLYDGMVLAEFIQTDAAINSGNSGGPVFDSRCRVIGVASRIVTRSGGSEGIGMAVAINTAKKLLALEDRAWLGLDGLFLSSEELAALFHVRAPGGLLVQHVTPGGPAARAGMRGGRIPAQIQGRSLLLGGDLILVFGGQEACHTECLVRAGGKLSAAARILVKLLRGGESMELVLDVAETRRSFLK